MGRSNQAMALDEAFTKLNSRYGHTLNIVEGFYGGKPFLHVSSKEFTQGLNYVSAFYIIVTCEQSEENSLLDIFQFSLLTCHGKKLTDMKVAMDPDALEDSKLPLLDDMASNNLHICQGIQDMSECKWKKYLSKVRDPLLDKVRNIFLIETLEDDVILRSRSCRYIVRNAVRNSDPMATDYGSIHLHGEFFSYR